MEATEVQGSGCKGPVDLSFCFKDYLFLIQNDGVDGCGACLFVKQADCTFEALLRVADDFYQATSCDECSMWQSRWHWADADDATLRERFKHVEGVCIIPEEYNGWEVSSRFTFGGIEFAVHGQGVYISAGTFGPEMPRDIQERDDIRCLMQTLGAVCR